MKQFKAIDDLVKRYSKKSTLIMVVSAKIEGNNLLPFYDQGFEMLTGNINQSKEVTGVEVSWYSIQRRDGYHAYYLTGNERFYKQYPDVDHVRNYVSACVFAVLGAVKMKSDLIKQRLNGMLD